MNFAQLPRALQRACKRRSTLRDRGRAHGPPRRTNRIALPLCSQAARRVYGTCQLRRWFLRRVKAEVRREMNETSTRCPLNRRPTLGREGATLDKDHPKRAAVRKAQAALLEKSRGILELRLLASRGRVTPGEMRAHRGGCCPVSSRVLGDGGIQSCPKTINHTRATDDLTRRGRED